MLEIKKVESGYKLTQTTMSFHDNWKTEIYYTKDLSKKQIAGEPPVDMNKADVQWFMDYYAPMLENKVELHKDMTLSTTLIVLGFQHHMCGDKNHRKAITLNGEFIATMNAEECWNWLHSIGLIKRGWV